MSVTRPLDGERYHLFGVGGRGMAPMAVAARHLGAEVTGCDRAAKPEPREFLATAGLDYEPEHSPAHVVPGVTTVATSVADPVEPELVAAHDAGAVWHRTDLLARLLRSRPSVGVTGSHGKGTVTALLAASLEAGGLDPLAVIGVAVPHFGGMVRLGEGPIVAEVDDSDLSLARVDTDVAVVTNLDQDHPHLPFSMAESVQGVGEFVSRARDRVVLGASPRAGLLAAYAQADVLRQGKDFSARTVWSRNAETCLELRGPDGSRINGLVRLVGAATASNAALAHATAVSLGVDPEASAAGLASIGSIRRRTEPMGIHRGVRVFDDFGGKHPVGVRAGLEALRRHYPEARLVAVFQPYGPFLPRWGRRYARALSRADHVVLAPAVFSPDYASDGRVDPGWTRACTSLSVEVSSPDEAASAAMSVARPGDVVVVFAQLEVGREISRLALQVEDTS